MPFIALRRGLIGLNIGAEAVFGGDSFDVLEPDGVICCLIITGGKIAKTFFYIGNSKFFIQPIGDRKQLIVEKSDEPFDFGKYPEILSRLFSASAA